MSEADGALHIFAHVYVNRITAVPRAVAPPCARPPSRTKKDAIPEELGKLAVLNYMDLSRNELDGKATNPTYHGCISSRLDEAVASAFSKSPS